MKIKNDSRIYTIVFYLSLLVTAVLICIMLLEPLMRREDPLENADVHDYKPGVMTTKAPDPPKNYEISENDLKILLNDVLKSNLGFEIDTLFLSDDNMTIMAKAKKADILKCIENSGVTISNAINIALKLAPETIEIDSNINLYTDNTQLNTQITKLSVIGFKVPVELMPKEFNTAISGTISAKLDEMGIAPTRISLKNGKLIISQ